MDSLPAAVSENQPLWGPFEDSEDSAGSGQVENAPTSMRIIAGQAKGRTLKAPRGQEIRPTSDRVRESLFNVLGQWCDGLAVLDLFCGTGALAFEALSRGAARAVLVDQGRQAKQLALENAQALGFADRVELLPLPVDRAVAALGRQGARFDLVFLDPPYALKAVQPVLEALVREGLLNEAARVVAEHGKHESAPDVVGPLAREEQRRFGETMISIYRLTGAAPA